jgi:carboxypeptidase C (cathepsin A)
VGIHDLVGIVVSIGIGPTQLNPHSWHHAANMLYIDQPVGTGMSWTNTYRYDNSDEIVNAHFYGFLQNFFKLHGNSLCLTAQSPV